MSAVDRSFHEGPELEEMARHSLSRSLARIQELEPTLQAQAPLVQPDSVLAADDRAMAPLHVSATARTPLIIALDHLILHGAALRELSRVQPTASYSLLRPAIEGAAWSIWMLSPASRDERVVRALQYVLLDQSGGRRLVVAGGHTPEHTADELKDELAEIAAKRPAVARAAWTAVPTAGSVIEFASGEVGELGAGGLTFWTALSGLAHGRPHGIMTLTQRDQLAVDAGGSVELRISPSQSILASGTAVALAYVETALDLYAKLCAGPGGPSPDAVAP